MKTIKENINYLAIWVGICFTIMVFAPVEIFLANRSFFWFTIVNIMYFAIPYFLIIFLMGTVVIVILNKYLPKCLEIIMTVVFGIAIATYIQGNYFFVNYGQLDGKRIPWEEYWLEGVASIALWVIVIVLCLILLKKLKKNKFNKLAQRVSIGIVMVQVITIATLMLTNNPFVAENVYSATDKEEFVYGDKENFVILMLDRFDSQVLIDILNEPDKDYNSILEDFTFYANTMGMYPCTDLAIPHILSGIPYQNAETYGEYITKAYSESSLLHTLDEENWSIGIYSTITLPREISNDSVLSKVVNWDDGNVGVNSHKNLSIYMYKLVGFRYLPQFLKQYCWFYPDDIAANEKIVKNDEADAYNWLNKNFYNQIYKIRKDDKIERCFKLIHIDGTHEGFTLNRALEEEKQTSITEEGRGVMMLVDEYLQKLKEQGIYDNSIIIIMADHGHYGKQQAPLLLIKGFEEKHAFQINEEAVSYSELCEAYKSLLDGASGSKLFSQNMEKRKYYFYKYKFKLEYEHYATDIIELESQGEAHDEEALYETGVVYKGRND